MEDLGRKYRTYKRGKTSMSVYVQGKLAVKKLHAPALTTAITALILG